MGQAAHKALQASSLALSMGRKVVRRESRISVRTGVDLTVPGLGASKHVGKH